MKINLIKKVFTISKEDKAKSATAFELAKNLPKIQIDLINNTYKSIGGKSVKILVNGISSDKKELLTMRPNEVYRIEYYDIVPSRFYSENVGIGINIITKSGIQGGDIFANVSSAVTTGFSDDYLLFRYNRNNNQISASYNLGYRDYNRIINNEKYSYYRNGILIEKLKSGRNSDLMYFDHTFNLRFLNTNDNRTFKIDFNNGLLNSQRDTKQDITQNISEQKIFSNYTDKTDQYSPNFDFYYNTKLKNNQEISANIVATLYKTKYANSILQKTDTNTFFSYFSEIENSKQSIILELLYEKKLDNIKFSTGITGSYSYSNQNNNAASYTTSVSSSSNEYYYFAEVAVKKIVSYNIGLGVRYNSFISNELSSKYVFYALRPRAYLAYDLTSSSNIRANSSIGQSSPSLSMLSSNVVYIDSIFLSKGNPSLRPYNTIYNSLEYSFTKPRFQFYLALVYNYLNKPFYQ